ncbi:hypothetical protein [Photorhabdus stackebrandtii]
MKRAYRIGFIQLTPISGDIFGGRVNHRDAAIDIDGNDTISGILYG